MRNYLLIVIIWIHLCEVIYCQKESATWIVGYDSDNKSPPQYGKTELHFTDDAIDIEYKTIEHDAKTSFINASICDSNGHLLMFTEGLNIYGSDQKIIINGAGLNPGRLRDDYNGFHYPSIYSHVFLPDPGNSKVYYLIHLASRWNVDITDTIRPTVAEKLYFTKNFNDGLRIEVIEKNILLLEGEFVTGHMAYCRHANGRDWWIIVEEYGSNQHFVYLLEPGGFRLHHKQNIGFGGNFYDDSGNSIFSSNGEKFAKYTYYNSIQIFDFDRCSGYFSKPVYINVRPFNQYKSGSLAFSPETKYLYFNNFDRVFQIDMNPVNGNYIIDTVGYWDKHYFRNNLPTAFFNMALGDDGVIYIGCYSSNVYLHTIRSPDLKGAQCGFELRSVLLPAFMNGTLPIMPNFKLGALSGTKCDSLSTKFAELCDGTALIHQNLCLDEIVLDLEVEDGSDFVIYSMQGYFVKEVEAINQRIDISELKNGMYILSCGMSGNIKGAKFVKL